MDDIADKLRKVKFTFAKTYAQSFPHEYTLQEREPEVFELMQIWINEQGYDKFFYGKLYRYLELDGYKYWIIGNVLNREPLEGYK